MTNFSRKLDQLKKAARSLARKSTAKALLRGVVPRYEQQALMTTLRPSMVLDVGANKGQFSLLARMLWPDCRIIAYEPLTAPARKFRALFGADPLVEFHQVAIGKKNESCEMHVSRRDDSSSLFPISKLQIDFAPGTDEVSTEVVRVAPLSDFLSPKQIAQPALLKIDVQGYELAVLEGCEPLLHRFDYIYCELSFRELYSGQSLSDDVIRWLHHVEFSLAAVSHISLDSANLPVQAHFLFRRDREREPARQVGHSLAEERHR